MRTLGLAAVSLGVLGLLLFWALGDTVLLRTVDANGSSHETRLWVVDHRGAAWLRSAADHGWLQRLQANPEVELQRSDRWDALRAVVSDSENDREIINRLMAEKYGLAESLIGGVFDHSMPVVVKLEPR